MKREAKKGKITSLAVYAKSTWMEWYKAWKKNDLFPSWRKPEENPKVREATSEELTAWVKKGKMIMGVTTHGAVFISKSPKGPHRKIKDPKKFIEVVRKNGYVIVTDGKLLKVWMKEWLKKYNKDGYLLIPKENIEVSASAPGGLGFKVATSEADIKGAESLHKMSKADQADTEKKMKEAGKKFGEIKLNPWTKRPNFKGPVFYTKGKYMIGQPVDGKWGVYLRGEVNPIGSRLFKTAKLAMKYIQSVWR